MKRLLVIALLGVLCLGLFGFILLRNRASSASTALPTVEVITPEDTATLSPTATPTSTATSTATPTPTATETPTPSATLATRVLVVTALNPALHQLAQAATDTLTPLPTVD